MSAINKSYISAVPPGNLTINDYLPEEIMYKIFSEHLSFEDRAKCGKTCQLWHRCNADEVKVTLFFVRIINREIPTIIGYNRYRHSQLQNKYFENHPETMDFTRHEIIFTGCLKTNGQLTFKAERENQIVSVILQKDTNAAPKDLYDPGTMTDNACKLKTIWKQLPNNYSKCSNQQDPIGPVDAIIATNYTYVLDGIHILEKDKMPKDVLTFFKNAVKELDQRQVQSPAIDSKTKIADVRVFSAPLLAKGPYDISDYQHV
jgi:hypothetical protein